MYELKKNCLKALFILGILSFSMSFAQNFNENIYYRLTTQWQGENKSLDVVDNKSLNKLALAKTGNYSGQAWKIKSLGNVFFRLTSQFKGEGKSIDISNDPSVSRNGDIKPILAPSGNYSGQFWKITSLGNGFYRMTTQFKGTGLSLDVINDGRNNELAMKKTGNLTGQYWKIVPFSGQTTKTTTVTKPSSNTQTYYQLKAGQILTKGTTVTCPNRSYNLKFQKDGNLALYGPGGRYMWDAKTAGRGERCTLQSDGNFVIYDKYNKALWSTETMSYFDHKFASRDWKPVKLEISNSGVCGLKSATGRIVWSCGNKPNSAPASSRKYLLKTNETLSRGEAISSANGNYTLKFQNDGNLALYGPNNRYMWDAKTAGRGERCTLQSDGNFVIYDKSNKALWSTETMSYFDRKFASRDFKPVKLEISNSGSCGLKSATGRVVWTCK